MSRIINVGVYFLLIGLLMFVAAGNLRWRDGWMFLTLYAGVNILRGAWVYVVQRRVDLLNRRGMSSPDRQKWDVYLVSLYSKVCLITPAVAAWERVRLGITSLPEELKAIGFLMLACSQVLLAWAMLSNQFFEGNVRIQREQNHTVVMQGPYRFIRHPGNISLVLATLSMPLLLQSALALAAALAGAGLLVLRTVKEDRFLQENLAGYAEYTGETRYMLLPPLL